MRVFEDRGGDYRRLSIANYRDLREQSVEIFEDLLIHRLEPFGVAAPQVRLDLGPQLRITIASPLDEDVALLLGSLDRPKHDFAYSIPACWVHFGEAASVFVVLALSSGERIRPLSGRTQRGLSRRA